MAKRDVYEELKDLQTEMLQIISKFEHVQAEVTKTLEQNAELKIENQHLREVLRSDGNDDNDGSNPEPQLSKSRQNLEKLYEEGFHVCNFEYGKRRENNEPCAFCLDVIYGER
ncbi:DNA replication initiation control protein YabA [Lactobacillus sp. LC28-10]|uniref:DNA replication initiation control protein YabA n=1 Tax=Secundilactobacillus angelensis TaxID=2722706 RepID=A0ABX1KZ13_9LACO|nr:DNA replication initiation control protein YabA [Secundilactobacillus angelensis]MCH5462224.1 DNA replication initiation control protein YabA [Secundilactobacillus angelensis]NLR18515.1 DNA replication initiation control protein YabA [Secundilactobacillus angelensis]